MAQHDEKQGDATDRQRKAGERRGERIPGKGLDAGSGYGGAGNDSAFGGGRGDGGQSGSDESTEEESAFSAGEGGFDADSPLGGERREPGR